MKDEVTCDPKAKTIRSRNVCLMEKLYFLVDKKEHVSHALFLFLMIGYSHILKPYTLDLLLIHHIAEIKKVCLFHKRLKRCPV